MKRLSRVTVTIRCDNAAFDERPELEVSRLLGCAADKVLQQMMREDALCDAPEGPDLLIDANGNTCGEVVVEMEEEDDEEEDAYFERGAGAALLGIGDIDSLEDEGSPQLIISKRRAEGKEYAGKPRWLPLPLEGDHGDIILEYNIYARKLQVACPCGTLWNIDVSDVPANSETAHMCPSNCGRGVVVKR